MKFGEKLSGEGIPSMSLSLSIHSLGQILEFGLGPLMCNIYIFPFSLLYIYIHIFPVKIICSLYASI